MLFRKYLWGALMAVSVISGFRMKPRVAKNFLPKAKAGPDQIIYLTKTSTVTLNGSSSTGSSFSWNDISTDYASGARIASPVAAVTQITGLTQGVWYFQLTATADGHMSRDTVIIQVDYAEPPENSRLLRNLCLRELAATVNIRDDTVTYWNYTNDPSGIHTRYFNRLANGFIYLERARETDMMIDSARGKIYVMIKDGHAGADTGAYGGTYARSELTFGKGFSIDSNMTYLFEWKGYFPQKFAYLQKNKAAFGKTLAILQIHPGGMPILQFSINSNGKLEALDNISGNFKVFRSVPICNLSDLYNQTHTIRTTIREGKSNQGQKAFLKIELDGVEKYYRNTGSVGGNFQHDYPKFGSLYDFSRSLVHPDSLSRGRTISLVTEEFNAYRLN